MKKRQFLLCLVLAAGILFAHAVAYASAGEDISYAARGVTKIVGGVFAIPKSMWQDSGRVLFPFGIVTGAVRGTVGMLGGVLGGAMDVARGAAPYAKYLVFL